MGVIDLYRTPLPDGGGLYNLPNTFNGRDEEGQPLPRVVVPYEVLPDGTLHWALPDFPENRKVVELSYNGRGPGGSTYTFRYPEAQAAVGPKAAQEAPTAKNQKGVAQEVAAAVAAPQAPAAPVAPVSAPPKGKNKGKGKK